MLLFVVRRPHGPPPALASRSWCPVLVYSDAFGYVLFICVHNIVVCVCVHLFILLIVFLQCPGYKKKLCLTLYHFHDKSRKRHNKKEEKPSKRTQVFARTHKMHTKRTNVSKHLLFDLRAAEYQLDRPFVCSFRRHSRMHINKFGACKGIVFTTK